MLGADFKTLLSSHDCAAQGWAICHHVHVTQRFVLKETGVYSNLGEAESTPALSPCLMRQRTSLAPQMIISQNYAQKFPISLYVLLELKLAMQR